jgi:hypothetical protein
LQRKKKNLFHEVDAEQKKKSKFIEEEFEKAGVKKLILDFDEEMNKKKGSSFESEDLDKKNGVQFDEVEIGKKKHGVFEEVKSDKEKKKTNFEEFDYSKNKKKGAFEEVEITKKRSDFHLDEIEKKKKGGTFEEVSKESIFNKNKEILIGGKKASENELDGTDKKRYEENVLDYSEFKKQYKEGTLDTSEEQRKSTEKKYIEKILEEPEYTFYDNLSFGLEYLVIHNDFLLKENISAENLFKFIHFALIKEYDGDISFYLLDPTSSDEEKLKPVTRLYSGHVTRKNELLGNDFSQFESQNMQKWIDTKLPFWLDETYQIETNEFIYPYFEEGKLLGFAVSHFKNTVNSHEDAAKIELLAMSLKGSIFDEYVISNGKKQ